MKKLSYIYVLAVLIATCFVVNAFAADFYVIPAQNKCNPCKGTRSAGGRWCDNGDGTVTDMTTCLVWLKYAQWGGTKPWRSNTSGDYDDARRRAGLLESGETISTGIELNDNSDLGDWRLPTKTELSGIINEGGETVYSSNPQLFIGVQSSYYWTGTTAHTFTPYAWRVHMVTGAVGGTFKTSSSYYVWPVHSYK
ncbi:MAG: DUF1566 domain-containing protein [Deltaproteobacteria bacterium]|nr:DUF1566 domain-containing protein [Deltaproteobacteria bacterium]MBW1849123.1 DUF1566 domain-containing protein [Deltaproteobacteria bacterium]MBW2364957.1 DUF1566 domain-containing protein [Deltaproteobacteria bacterium]